MQYFIKTFEESVKSCWGNPALNDYKSEALTYGELARKIETWHLIWKAAGLKEGDKISLNARSSSNWATTFMAATSGGYVSCQLFNGFTPADTQKMVNHSDTKILFTEKAIFEGMNFNEMPQLIAAIDMKNMELLASRSNFADIYARAEELFAEAHPDGWSAEDVKYIDRDMDDLCCLNYTSGSTGTPKGVMLTVRNISSNVDLIPRYFPYRRGDNYLSILPFAHIFGMLYDMTACLCTGMHLTILCLPPAPTILKDAMQSVSPCTVMMVPLVLKKMAEYSAVEILSDKANSELIKNSPEYYALLRSRMMANLGGKVEIIVTGGAALPEELEKMLIEKLQLPLVTGYGMTECGPTITLGKLGKYKLKSCGILVDCMQIEIDSPNPHEIVGEVLVKGCNTFVGYYKNPEADKEVFTENGWFRTGDLGTIDKENNLFLVGRNKSLLLGSNGENVYPEEIEVKLNVLPYVAESLIVQRGEKFIALIVPNADMIAAANISAGTLEDIMEQNITTLNKSIPAFAQVSGYELQEEAFAKTPKGSIKRFKYA
ncbi:MAG: AMP-binding protein [Bacteroidaceae bacterium]|nr:AMP-binding protein [Bacteroidaceae bacterium]MBQ8565751.1 AMP-binding protein [Bacteroidaceae bacterium]